MKLSRSFPQIALYLMLITYCNGYSYSNAEIPEGYTIIEGDIQIPIHQTGIEMVFERNFWEGGIVPFEFDNNVTTTNQTLMLNAMQVWENVANVQFVARQPADTSFLHIQNSTENSSPIGPQGGQSTVNIFNWNMPFIMAHELAHSLGFWHEQSSPIRDTYITINTNNIGGGEHNFEIRSTADFYGYYDFDSVMHYGQCAFSNCALCDGTTPNCWTITVKPPYDGIKA